MTLDLLYKICAIFSQDYVIMPLAIGGIIIRRDLFLPAVMLLLFSTVFSAILKFGFNIPYPEELVKRLGKNGLSFPSGHMQASSSFYGWFLFQNFGFNRSVNILLKLILITIIAGVGIGLIGLGYHNIWDIGGALFFAIISIYCYRILVCKFGNRVHMLLPIFCLVIVLIMHLLYHIPQHLYLSLYSMAGISFYIFAFKEKSLQRLQLFYLLTISIVSVILLTIFNLEILKDVQWFFLGFMFMIFSEIFTYMGFVKKNDVA